jgi:hypothetical protein
MMTSSRRQLHARRATNTATVHAMTLQETCNRPTLPSGASEFSRKPLFLRNLMADCFQIFIAARMHRALSIGASVSTGVDKKNIEDLKNAEKMAPPSGRTVNDATLPLRRVLHIKPAYLFPE